MCLLANFTTEHRVNASTLPAGRQLIVDAAGVDAPASWWWVEGSMHTFDVSTPQTDSIAQPKPTTRYQFVSWSDGGAQRHSIVVTAPVSLTATFTVEHLVDLLSSQAGTDVIVDGMRYATPASVWWYSGTSHDVEAVSSQVVGDIRFVFVSWSNGGARNQSLSGDASWSLTATYAIEYNVTIDTDPSGLRVLVDGADLPSPASFWWPPADVHTIGGISPQAAGDTRWSFLSWSDSGAISHPITISGPGRLVARFQAEYLVTFDTNPPGLPVDVDGVSAATPRSYWWKTGETHAIGAQSLVTEGAARHLFSEWSDGGDRAHGLEVAGAGHFVASFSTEYQIRLLTDPLAFLLLTVDGANLTAPAAVWWASGSVHRVVALSPQGAGATRHAFRAWADSSDPQDRMFTVASAANLTAHFDLQHRVSLVTSPPGLLVIVDGEPLRTPGTVWWNVSTNHTLEVQAEQSLDGNRYRFDSWSQSGPASQTFTAREPVELRATFTPVGGSGDSGGLLALAPFALIVAAAGAAVAAVVLRRRKSQARASAEAAEPPADSDLVTMLASVPSGLPPASAAEAGPVGEAPVPCPQCGSPVAIGASPCPQCGLDLVWD